VVQVDGGEWRNVDFKSSLKLRATISACDNLAEIEAWVVHGSQWSPFVKE